MARRGAIEVTRHKLQLALAGANVPGIMLLPSADRPVPAALLLHGYSSTKERLIDSMGRALAARSIASLAIDLPLHGGRDDALVEQARSNPLAVMQHWLKRMRPCTTFAIMKQSHRIRLRCSVIHWAATSR